MNFAVLAGFVQCIISWASPLVLRLCGLPFKKSGHGPFCVCLERCRVNVSNPCSVPAARNLKSLSVSVLFRDVI